MAGSYTGRAEEWEGRMLSGRWECHASRLNGFFSPRSGSALPNTHPMPMIYLPKSRWMPEATCMAFLMPGQSGQA